MIRASQSANSENLLEDVSSIVQKNNSTAFKLIQMGILLDSPKVVPRNQLKHLYKDVEKDLVARRVIPRAKY